MIARALLRLGSLALLACAWLHIEAQSSLALAVLSAMGAGFVWFFATVDASRERNELLRLSSVAAERDQEDAR